MKILLPHSSRGLTLIELLVSLSVLAVISTAAVSMLRAASQVNTTITAAITNEWEVESALHRMVQQLRQCGSFSVPNSTSAGTTYSLVTQPDPANGNAIYNVSYSLLPNNNGTFQLQETDSRFGTTTLINDVRAFDVRYKNAGAPYVIVITLTAGQFPGVTRTLKVMPRNQ